MKKVISFMALVALLLVCTGGPVAEDSLPGPPPPVKWQQRPDMAGGAVIASTLATPPALTAAEDWLCFDGSAVSDLHFWGAYAGWQDQTIEPSLPPPGIERFRLRIFSDSPATYPGSFSRPDKLLYESWVDNFNESYIDTIALPDGRFEHVYRYDLGLPRLFFQRPDRIYWLNIAAEPLDAAYDWGWETSIDHWNDVAVEGWYENFDSWFWSPVTHPFSLEPVNMSFAMTGCGGPFKWLQL
ncbi:MAG: hypothetical protein PVF46_05235, partial [Lysobacterales bacterium]